MPHPDVPLTVTVHTLPPMFWQSQPCHTCGAQVGKHCTFPSGAEATYTVHPNREADVKAEAALDVIRGVLARQSAQTQAELMRPAGGGA